MSCTNTGVDVAVVPSAAVAVDVSFKTTAAVEAAATDCAVVTQVACADAANNEGKNAAVNVTDSAASKRKALNQSPDD